MAIPAQMWIEGTELHFIDASGNERAQEGTATGAKGIAGHSWIEEGAIHYIDANGDERVLPSEYVGSGSTVSGQMWLQGNWVRYTVP